MFHVFVRFFCLDPAQNPTKTHFFRQDNQSKVSTNLFATNLRTKNKRLCRVTVDSTSIATALFLLLKSAEFHNQSLDSLIGKFDSEGTEFYLLGDLNCNLASSTIDNNTSLLTTIADVYGLHQLIDEPTRISNLTPTLIDVNLQIGLIELFVLGSRISDHSLVYVYRKLSIDHYIVQWP